MTKSLNHTQKTGYEKIYQIDDDEIDESEDFGEESLLEEANGHGSEVSGRGPYERAWTTDATRALIHIRGPMEERFNQGRQKRTALWLLCTRQLHKQGFRYGAAKVQKKWHNILITYNKNLFKKSNSWPVHWEFFEEMYKYLEGKKANCESSPVQQNLPQHHQSPKLQEQQPDQKEKKQPRIQHNKRPHTPDNVLLQLSDDILLQEKEQLNMQKPKIEYEDSLPLQISHAVGYEPEPGSIDGDIVMPAEEDFVEEENLVNHSSSWWKDYFERKLQMDREKIQLQKDMHRDLMQYHRMSLAQQEKLERSKIDAINNLAKTLQKFTESRSRKPQ